MEKTVNNIIIALKYYVPIKYHGLNNWNVIVNRCVEVEENVFQYKCSFFTLYFNDVLEPVTYDNQYVIDCEVYYDVNGGFVDGAGTYMLLGDVDWYNKKDYGL